MLNCSPFLWYLKDYFEKELFVSISFISNNKNVLKIIKIKKNDKHWQSKLFFHKNVNWYFQYKFANLFAIL